MRHSGKGIYRLIISGVLLMALLTGCGGGGTTDTTGSAPSAPSGVTATAGDGQATISWNSVLGATSYNIYWSTTSGVTKTTGTKITGATSPYTHTGLTNGTTYYYVITAVNSYGESIESSQVSVTPSTSTTQTTSVTTTLSSQGGTVQLSDGSTSTIESNILKETTSLSFSKIQSSLTSTDNAEALSSTYQLEIPVDKIADSSGGTKDWESYMTIEIPVTTNSASRSSLERANKISDDAYKVSRVVIDYGSNTLTLFGSYVSSGGKVIVKVTKESLVYAKQKATDAKIKIKSEILSFKKCFDPFNIQSQLYQVNSNSDFVEVTSSSQINLNGKIPIILIHGWQTATDFLCIKDPHITVWKNLIEYFYLDINSDLRVPYALFSYRYDSDDSIDDNAIALKDKIDNIFGGISNIVLIGKSMGGLLAHTYIQKHNGGSKVSKVITLGTPYHGSPLVQVSRGVVKLVEGVIQVQGGISLPIESLLSQHY